MGGRRETRGRIWSRIGAIATTRMMRKRVTTRPFGLVVGYLIRAFPARNRSLRWSSVQIRHGPFLLRSDASRYLYSSFPVSLCSPFLFYFPFLLMRSFREKRT